jgi:energy-converting hydrogenase Eha subunit A
LVATGVEGKLIQVVHTKNELTSTTLSWMVLNVPLGTYDDSSSDPLTTIPIGYVNNKWGRPYLRGILGMIQAKDLKITQAYTTVYNLPGKYSWDTAMGIPSIIIAIGLGYLFIRKLGLHDTFAQLMVGISLAVSLICIILYVTDQVLETNYGIDQIPPPGHYPQAEAFYAAISLWIFIGCFLLFGLLEYLTLKVRVYDVAKDSVVSIHLWQHPKKCCVVSYMWDYKSAAEFPSSNILQRTFKRAKALGLDFVMFDAVTLDQKSVDAKSVLRFVRYYSYLPVIVGVETDEEISKYKGRFWTNVEILKYHDNPLVSTLSDEKSTAIVSGLKNDYNTVTDVIHSRTVTATFNLDRLRVFLLEIPFANAMFGSVFKELRELNQARTDLGMDGVEELLDYANFTAAFLETRWYFRLGVFRIIWVVIMIITPTIFPNRYKSGFQAYSAFCFCLRLGFVALAIGMQYFNNLNILIILVAILLPFLEKFGAAFYVGIRLRQKVAYMSEHKAKQNNPQQQQQLTAKVEDA